MDDKKITFITAISDESLYSTSLNHIRKLVVPDGFKVEAIAIRGAKSLCSAYNEAMFSNDAKYKIYLHQDTFIINRNCLIDVVNIFISNGQIGMIGVTGCETIPANGIWWEGPKLVGKVIEHRDTFGILRFNDCNQPYCYVTAIDGLMMITQYDIPWREDLFNGFHFYDTSQSLEFINNGYKVCVPKQLDPWCLHACGTKFDQEGYNYYRNIFLENYIYQRIE
jgi:hypothetical protein